MRSSLRSLELISVVLALSTTLFGQDMALVTGTVTDISGAVIRDAQVSVTNHANGLHRVTTTNSTGAYLVDGLLPGSYEFLIHAAGFKLYQANEIVLRIVWQQVARLDAVRTWHMHDGRVSRILP